jgi:bifunctional polynucleotide phosphatase/kinase
MSALVRKNLTFHRCIDNIDDGINALSQLEIKNHYRPTTEFQPVDNGDMFFSIPNIAKPQPFIAAFDLDWTLVGCEHKLYPGSASSDDIVILPGRREILTDLVKSGYTLAIFTNQKAKTPKPLKRVLSRITKFLVELGLPCYVFVSTGVDHYRKPDVGMWQQLQKLIPHIEYAFYVGDAAGRPQDFSDSDRLFASNIGIQFYTPEDFFPCQRIPFPNKDSNLVVLVGAPGSGKSMVANDLANRGYTVVSRDKLGGRKKKYFNEVKKSLKNNTLTVADATNGLQSDRDELYKYARDSGRTVSVLYMLRSGRGWAKLRDKPIPDIAYHSYYKRMVPPTHANTLVISEPCLLQHKRDVGRGWAKKSSSNSGKIKIAAGIYDRKFLAELGKVPRKIKNKKQKAQLKWKQMNVLIMKYHLKPDQVWFYDDVKDNVSEAGRHGVNSILVSRKPKADCCLTGNELEKLVEIAEKDPDRVRLVIFDWDYTFASVNFGKKCKTEDVAWVVEHCLGGQQRLDNLRTLILKLESLGAKIGFITYNSKKAIVSILEKVGWIDATSFEDTVPDPTWAKYL